ncbi:MAG: hypothetical protein EBE86_018445 [Hormoscilla sp. GUM202]|nr:hypothetical protein [Hormoscilla sp. GUM202]
MTSLARSRLSQVMEYLRSHRCLLVVDDVQTIYGWRQPQAFSSGQLAGHYKDGYKDYRILWKQVGYGKGITCRCL